MINKDEELYMSYKASMIKKGKNQHSWLVLESDLPNSWIKTRPKSIVREWTHPKSGLTWKFELCWFKNRKCPILRASLKE
jgi:hypothetical protein